MTNRSRHLCGFDHQAEGSGQSFTPRSLRIPRSPSSPLTAMRDPDPRAAYDRGFELDGQVCTALMAVPM